MKLKKLAASITAVATGVLGLTLLTAGPAAAATGNWRPYGNTNPITSSPSTWLCASTKTVTTDILAQVCVIRTPYPDTSNVQGAVIVRNNRSSLFSVQAAVDLSNQGGPFIDRWTCRSSGVAAHSWSVCFGATIPNAFRTQARGGANGVDLGVTLGL
ncbi:hypothetical protein JIG36_28165 [Actinoplanes sp. LDG1-06]|uniref:Secreted protein n=1 Tax=Paractinoplanes ovalisporus TaxID=2810368 RepID=A0ABS2AHZ7_9ACTN|nr:hypothetical protein [Actinoplanes ovalisporus]MBM2619435.1 hypothetical protein [Actinoplanes ovalisporus]